MTAPWEVPQSWCWTTMGEVAEVVGGGTPRTNDPSNFQDRGIPWVTPADLSGFTQKTISRGARDISQKGLDDSAARLLPAGTVLFSSRAPIGYVAIAGQPVATNQGFKSFVLPPDVDPEFAYYYLLRARELALSLASGTTFMEVSGRQAAKIPFALAPFAEQLRIVQAIESYLPRLDDCVTGLERVQRNLKRYRASVLQAAVEGRLVPTEAELARAEGRDYEPASVLLGRLLVERRRRWEEAELKRLRAAGKSPNDDRWKARYPHPVPADTSGLPDLPEGWCWTTAEALSDQTRSITYGVVKLGPETTGGVLTLRSSNVRHLALDIEYVKPISPKIASLYRRTELQGGEVLITVRGTLGGVVVVPKSCRSFNISREVAMVALVEPDLGPLFACFVGSSRLQNWMLSRTKGITYTGVNIETLKQLPIPLPPHAEHNRIVRAVERHLSIEAAIGTATQASAIRSERLRQSILMWAFEGKLADQDPADEPAAVLLERIRKSRVAAAEGPRPASARGGRRTRA